MRIKNANWSKDLQEAAMNTINKKWDDGKEMTPELFRKYIISEHSPIRGVELRVSLLNIPYYNSVHIARHVHAVHYVTTNRPDRTGKQRSPDDTVNHLFDINVQGLIDMMRKRLCIGKVDETTYKIMLEVKKFLMHSDDAYMKVLGECLVPNCVYRGGCPEFKSCGFFKSNTSDHYINYNKEG